MDKDLFQNVLIKVLILVLMVLNAGFCYSVRTDDHVNFPEQISAWTGSCVLIPCYEKDNRRINNFLWYQNPEYDDDKKQWTRTVVYDNKNTKKVDSHFEGRVKPYVGQGNGACGIVLHNVQEGDSGYYRLRTIDGNDQWMTKKNVSLTVSDSGPELMIRPVGVGREYQKLTLSCYVHYYCPDYDIKLSWDGDVRGETKTTVPRLEWSVRNKKPIMTEAEFTFTPTWEDHNKTIQCALTKGDSEVTKTGPVVLNIQYSPKGVRIRPETSPVTISKGEEVALECTAESSNPPIDTYRWYKSANNIVGSNSHYSARESGTYYCEAENTIGRTRSKGVAINVLYAPTVTLKIPSREIREGSQYTLTCSVDANPQLVNITWYKDYEKILNKNRDTLTFPYIREQESGSYHCEAQNIIGSESSADVYVDVVYAPKNPEVVVEPKKPSFVEGSSLRFSCNVNSSNPGVSQITWYKNEKVMASERKNYIIIDTIKEEHHGNYMCKAGNKIGATSSQAVSINVLYPPKGVRVTPQAQIITEGDRIRLACSVDKSNPTVTEFRWYKDSALQPHRNKEITFPGIKRTDSGKYTCEARNGIGNVTSQPITLNVQYAPVGVMVSSIPSNLVTEHTKVTLTCTAQAYPNTISYAIYKDGVLLKYSQSLVLDYIQLSDGGEYYCMATNSIGSGTSRTIDIHVSYGLTSIGKYIGIAVGIFTLLVLLIVAIHFKIWKMVFRFKADDSESHFIVMKKTHPELPDNAARQSPPVGSHLDQLNYSIIQFPPQPEGGAASRTNPNDQGVIYSVLQKTSKAHEYENTTSGTQEENSDEIHYSTIANLPRGGMVPSRTSEVEYAMLSTQQNINSTQQNIYS
ncbi:hypothetical protein XENTR_v10019584 [Xenopus tropicalis]|uniref:B-cell receptor CD22 n=1 Tax=Xenopus tropicalis TaxID=8364 RepID=A0A6I8SYD5_XENTR|nr:B-cell receptor CD22 [Xenopus tropicalis]KAE8594331.1 hypothetical protein XENTR_v10019584 [Xenopus tropicalis]